MVIAAPGHPDTMSRTWSGLLATGILAVGYALQRSFPAGLVMLAIYAIPIAMLNTAVAPQHRRTARSADMLYLDQLGHGAAHDDAEIAGYGRRGCLPSEQSIKNGCWVPIPWDVVSGAIAACDEDQRTLGAGDRSDQCVAVCDVPLDEVEPKRIDCRGNPRIAAQPCQLCFEAPGVR